MINLFHKNSNMTTNQLMRTTAALTLSLGLLAPMSAFAETTGTDAALNADVSAQTTTIGGKTKVAASATLSATVMTRAKTKADNEIDRRIKSLTDLSSRVSNMAKVSADFKQNLATNINNQVTALTTLKAKIDADTDGDTLKADIKTVSQAYRVYMLVIPQSRIAAAADREAQLISMMAGLGTKLQARIQQAQTAGADVTALVTALSDMGTQLGNAQTHAQTAVTSSATLTPDNGDQTQMKANTTALQNARKEIVAAQQALVAARKDADTIVKGLKTLKVNTTSSTTVQTH
jgi:hypothetical protein